MLIERVMSRTRRRIDRVQNSTDRNHSLTVRYSAGVLDNPLLSASPPGDLITIHYVRIKQ